MCTWAITQTVHTPTVPIFMLCTAHNVIFTVSLSALTAKLPLEAAVGDEPIFLRFVNTAALCLNGNVPAALQPHTVLTDLVVDEGDDGSYKMMLVERTAGDMEEKQGWVEVVSTYRLQFYSPPAPTNSKALQSLAPNPTPSPKLDVNTAGSIYQYEQPLAGHSSLFSAVTNVRNGMRVETGSRLQGVADGVLLKSSASWQVLAASRTQVTTSRTACEVLISDGKDTLRLKVAHIAKVTPPASNVDKNDLQASALAFVASAGADAALWNKK
jgi:hypothetical protein